MIRLRGRYIAAVVLLMLTQISQAKEPVPSTAQVESDDLLEFLKAEGFAYIERKQIFENASGVNYTRRVKDHITWFRRQGINSTELLTKALLAVDGRSIENNLEPKIAWLREQGVQDTGKLIRSFPQVLRLSLEDNLKPKIAWLRELGVEDVGKLLGKFPAILTLSIEDNLKPKVAWFKSQGVHDVGKLISVFPQVISLSIEDNLKTKVAWLRDRGVQDIGKLISSFPQVLTLSLNDNLKPKIVWFKKQGFKDVPKLIETFPAVMSYSITDNLAPKLIEFVNHWKIGIAEVEYSPKLFKEDLPQMQGVRRTLDEIAKMAGDSGFNFSSLSIEQRKYLIRHMSEDLIFEKLKDVKAIHPERRSLSELTPTERSVLIGLYRKPGSLQRLILSTGRGRAGILKEVSCHVDFLKEKLQIQ